MITQFSCKCGNNDPRKAMHYDGSIGYEATVCRKCGRYSDHNGEYDADEWSKQFIQKEKPLTRYNIDLNKVNLLNLIK
jgi:hypothetical protein